MTFKTGLLITGDASTAKAAVEELKRGVEQLGASGRKTAADLAATEKAQADAAATARKAAADTEQMAAALREAQSAAAAAHAEMGALQAENARLIGDLRQSTAAAAGLEAQLQQNSRASAAAAGSVESLAQGLASAKGEIAALQSVNAGLAQDLNRAQAAGAALDGELKRTQASAAGAAADVTKLRTELGTATGAIAALEASNTGLTSELKEAKAAAAGLAGQLDEARTASAALAGRVDVLETKLKGAGQAHRAAGDDAARNAAATRNLGQQFGDLAVMIQGGISPARAFATQAGQMGYAMSDMSGKAGAVGRFLVGPFGIAATVATAALAPLVEELINGSDAADDAKEATENLSKYVDDLGNYFDKTTGQIKQTNSALREYAVLARQQERDKLTNQMAGNAREGARLRDESLRDTAPVFAERGLARNAPKSINFDVDQALKLQGPARDEALRTIARSQSSNAGQAAELLKQRAEFAERDRRRNQLDREIGSFQSGVLDPSLRDAPRKPRTVRERKQPSTEARDEFGRDAGDKIAGIVGAFDGSADAIAKTNAKVRELDDLIEDLGRKKPPGFGALIGEAERAKVAVREGLIAEITKSFEVPKTLGEKAAAAYAELDAVAADLEQRRVADGLDIGPFLDKVAGARRVIEDGLDKPFRDFIDAQDEQYRVGELILQGRTAEAAALRTILGLERDRGPLSAAQKDAILGSTLALEQQERTVERLRRRQQAYLGALDDVRAILRDTIYEGPDAVLKLPQRIFESFKRAMAEKLTEQWFGSLFDELRDDVLKSKSGVDRALDARVGGLAGSVASAGGALDRFVGSLDRASGAIGSGAGGSTDFGQTRDRYGNPYSDLLARGARAGDPSAGGDPGDVVVTGRKRQSISEHYGSIFEKGLKNIGISDDAAGKIGRASGKALGGAFEGQAAAGVASMLGIKTSGTGAGIGGAIGGLTGLPGGAIIGGLAGGLLGNALVKPKYGTAAIVSADADASVAGRGSAQKAAAGSLAGQVQQGLRGIADQLGAELGAFQVSIGQYKDEFRVSTTGYGGKLQGGKPGVVGFGKDGADAAVQFAIADAIKDGAVMGLTAAENAALRSTTDLAKAVKEVLSVRDVAELLGGPLAQYQKAFREFDRTAVERVRVARQYGFDVLAIEKRNADDRLKLADQLAGAQTGSLKALVAELTGGSLFEGTAMERIAALDAQIAKAKSDLDANVDGAGDRLADLYGRRLSARKDAYGTTGEYAADRTATLSAVQAAIAQQNARVAEAQAKASDPALATTNKALDENNDQNAEMLAGQKRIEAALLALGAGGSGMGGGFDLTSAAAF